MAVKSGIELESYESLNESEMPAFELVDFRKPSLRLRAWQIL